MLMLLFVLINQLYLEACPPEKINSGTPLSIPG
jgi:hypothetical protein